MQVEQGFFSFFDDFSKFHSAFGALHFENSSNMSKNEEKPFTTCVQPITQGHFQKPET